MLFLLFIVTNFCYATTSSYAESKIISLNLSDATIKDIFTEIEKNSEFIFFYKNEDMDSERKVSIEAKSQTISQILSQLFDETEYSYMISDRQVFITKNELVKTEVAMTAQPPVIKVTGTVTDKRDPILGVTIVIKGTTFGVITDDKGAFSIDVPNTEAVLQVSCIGYTTQEVRVGNRTNIDIFMSEDTSILEELVVVGFGTQKKVHLTGAIATVDSKEFESRPVTNVAQALQGRVANLNVSNSSGAPNASANFNIRGYAGRDGTGGATYSPLVIVDGVTGYLNDLNPNDIESVTILKDAASSAIYGAQASYGVMLITTKSGKRNQKPTISYNNNVSWNSPTVLPKTAGSLEFAKLFREASINSGGSGVIDLETMERIEKYYYDPTSIPSNVPNAEDPKRYADWGDGRSNANEDWADAMFLKWQMSQQHNVSVQGGSDRSSYMMSLGFQNTSGKLRYYDDNYERFNVAAKISSDVTNWLTVSTNFRYAKDRNDTPAYAMDPNGGINSLINWIWVVWPTIPLRDPNGHFAPAGRMHYIAEAKPHLTYTDNFWGTGSALFKILPGLTANLDFTYNKYLLKRTYSIGVIDHYDVNGEPYASTFTQENSRVWQRSDNDDFSQTQFFTTYEKEFGGHSFKIMGGMQQDYKKNYRLDMNRRALILPDQPSVATASGALEASDALDHWTTRGFFGRFNYFYKSKYLFEFNVRRDGSSRYAEGYKWGTFPGALAAWNVAREDFFEGINKYLSDLKFRASYGELGNQRGASYQYISTVSYNSNSTYIMDGKRIGTFGTPGLISYNTWETNRTLDFGVDVAAFNNRLTISYDWYQRDILGMIAPGEPLPAVLGATAPDFNGADLRNRGFELSVVWRDQFNLIYKPLSYRIYANLSDYTGKVMKYYNPTGLLNSGWYEGRTLGEIWGYTTDHIMIDAAEAAEVQSSGSQRLLGSNWSRGDMKYVDLNGDGQIGPGNNTLDDPGDRSIIGNSTPRYNFGVGFSADWNNFDLAVHFQGTGKRDLWLSGRLAWGLGGGQWGSNVWQNTLDCWREDGRNLDPYWPRFYLGSTGKNLQTQTKYLDNAAYCRLKNLQFGYTIPKLITKKMSMDKLRIYFSGENLLTFTKINENFDPEAPSDNVYPLTKLLSMGLQVTF